MAEADTQHRDYQKESKSLINFCRKMIDKKDKEAGYIDLEQQGVPDVKPISKKELDEKIAEAIIRPKKAQNIGRNTIPPYYSLEICRYEPPLPVKEREQEEVLEKVRKMTNGGSKGSKSEKQAEGETELSWDHEGLEPYPGPEKPKPQRSPKGSKLPEKEVDKRVSPEVYPKCKRNHDEKDCIRISPEKIERNLPPPKDSKEVPEGNKKIYDQNGTFKRGRLSLTMTLSNGWMNRIKFWKEEEKRKDRGKQKESIPRKF